ncbi:MAG: HAD superfamily hydrolase (TIGR01450 family) [Candidatus Paceibacteria bacterium]|jgi:HAD superfamily hydrolase (TIGR01450 family)
MKKAIILVAGVGSRLRPMTDSKPKTMIEANGVPMLGHILSSLSYSQIKEVTLVCGYRSDQIQLYCVESFPELNFNFIENKDYGTTNNLYSLYLAKKHLNDDTLIMNGDLVFDKGVIKKLMNTKGSAIAVDVGLYQDESMKVVVEDGHIKNISKQITPEDSHGCSIDVYKFTKSDLVTLVKELEKTIKSGNLNEWTEAAFDRLFSEGKIKPKVCAIGKDKWFEIDNLDDLADAEIKFNTKLKSLSNKKVFFFDNDGTLTLGGKAIGGSKSFLEKVRENKKKLFVLTNNSSRTPADITKSLKKLGLNFNEKEVLISTEAAMLYLKKNKLKKIFLVANKKTSKWIESKGFKLEDKNPQAVLLCYDTEINYKKIELATKFIREGVPYFATHIDQVCPTKDGFVPDIGTFIDMFESATQDLPAESFGKPNPNFIKPVLEKLKLKAKDSVIIGDRLYTDIKLANDIGATSVLVLSGETSRADYEMSDIRADIVVRNLSELERYL